jgi:hypothetical protein
VRADAQQHLLLAIGRVDRRIAVALDAADIDDDAGPLVEQADNLCIEVIDARTQARQVLGLVLGRHGRHCRKHHDEWRGHALHAIDLTTPPSATMAADESPASQSRPSR